MQQIKLEDVIGSGPFIFKADEWKPGEKTVYVKNPKYKPRAEPPSGLAGGKVVKLDRVEWIWISDVQTQVAAIQNGEIDMIEAPGHDLLPLLATDKNINLLNSNPTGNQYTFRFNSTAKPFDNRQDPSRRVRRLRPGGFPQGHDRRSAVVQGLQGALRLRHAARQRRRHGRRAERQRRQGQAAPDRSRLRRHADRADAVDRPAGADQPRAGRQGADGAGRLQGRHGGRWTGRRWSPAAPRRTRRTRAAGMPSSPRGWRPTSSIR